MRLWLVAALVCLAWPLQANADVIDFTTLSISPAQTITLDAITIRAGFGYTLDDFHPSGVVSIVEGIGLGLGIDGSIDKTFSYTSEGVVLGGDPVDGALSIAVDGRINSITIASYYAWDGPPDFNPNGFPFQVRASGGNGGGGLWGAFMNNNTATMTFDGYQPSLLTNVGDFESGYIAYWLDNLWASGAKKFTVSFGTSITSIDYTPNRVPEPSTLLLSAIGLAGAAGLKRRHG